MTSLFDQPVGPPPKPKRAPRAKAKPKPKAKPDPNDKSMPDWLVHKLENDGVLDASQPGPPATRRTHMIFCPRCRHPVMRGLRPMPMPWPVDADPQPLSPEGEALALLSGVKTYELRWRYDHYEIDHRDAFALFHYPAAMVADADIVAEHRCGEPARWPHRGSRLPPPPSHTMDAELPDKAPF